VVLTGLVFVALSLNVNVVTQDATHRYRAMDTLTAMTGIFVICAFALMGGQDHRALGIEWIVVAPISIAVYLHGYVQAVRRGGSIAWLRRRRVIVAAVLYLAQLVGAALLVADHIAGLYVAAVAMVAALTLMISGAWLLVVGVTMREPKPFDRSPYCRSGGRQPLRRGASRLQVATRPASTSGSGRGPHRDALAAIGSRPPATSRPAPPEAPGPPRSRSTARRMPGSAGSARTLLSGRPARSRGA
jgi:hypothetical protein